MTSRRYLLATLVAPSTLLLSACGGAATIAGEGAPSDQVTPGVTKTSILIGTSNALTGSVASVCQPVSEGARAWFEQVNATGGIHGRNINDRILDDAYQAPQAAANVKTLQSAGVFALFGGCGTVTAATITTIVKGTDMPYLFPYAAFDDLVHPTVPNIYSLLPLYNDQARSLIPHVIKRDGVGSVYAATSEIPGYEADVAAVTAASQHAGATFLGSSLLPLTAAPDQQTAVAISDAHPDYLMLTVLAPDAARILNAMAAAGGLPAKGILGVSVLASQGFADSLAAPAAQLLSTVSPTVPPGNPHAAGCESALKSYAPSIKPDAFALFGCATAQAFVAALDKAGPNPTRESLYTALNSMQSVAISSLLPPVTFTATNHMGLETLFLLQLKSGRFEVTGTLPVTTR